MPDDVRPKGVDLRNRKACNGLRYVTVPIDCGAVLCSHPIKFLGQLPARSAGWSPAKSAELSILNKKPLDGIGWFRFFALNQPVRGVVRVFPGEHICAKSLNHSGNCSSSKSLSLMSGSLFHRSLVACQASPQLPSLESK